MVSIIKGNEVKYKYMCQVRLVVIHYLNMKSSLCRNMLVLCKMFNVHHKQGFAVITHHDILDL